MDDNYKLQESPRIYYNTVPAVFEQLGLKKIPTESCIFIKNKGRNIVMAVILYADDLLFSEQSEEIKEFEKQMNKNFKLKTMEKLKHFWNLSLRNYKMMQ
eukprot:snap_masked-scaffold_24-processed-gene-3.3-mRNA-1 protein AED:1.00 eAED:1.00 QI:0/0/0/0/1/1/2/0/99